MNSKPQVLIVEDQKKTLADYLRTLHSDEYDLTGVRSLAEATAALKQEKFDVVVTDLELFEQVDGGMQVIAQAKALDATIAVIVVTVHSNAANASRAIRELGARAFFPKPLDFAACRQRIHEAILERRYRLAAIEAASRGAFMPIRSPYVAGKPLAQNNVMFYGRDELFDFIRANVEEEAHQNHLVLVGPRRIGKTSVLQQLPARLGPSSLPVYINCQALGIDPGMPTFFLQLSRQIRRSLQAQGLDVSGLPALTEADLGRSPAMAFSDAFLPRLRPVLDGRSLALCLDEFEELEHKVQRGRLEPVVFTFLRQLMQTERQIVCILAGTRRLEELGAADREAASILNLAIYRRIGVLPPDLAGRLIEEPVAYSGISYQAEAVEGMLRATGGYPYLIQLLCGLLVNRRNEQQRNEMTPEDVQAAITALAEAPQPGFFWNTLRPRQQAVLISACQLWRNRGAITAQDVEAELQTVGVSCQNWKTPIHRLLHELALEELLCEEVGDGQNLQYSPAFELLSAWVRRHKVLDQIRFE